MPELDDTQIREALERLQDRSASSVDVEARLDELHARTANRAARRRWGQGLLAVAAVVALVAGSVAVFRDGGDRVVTSPAGDGFAHDPDAKAILDRAVQATRDAPGWVALVTTAVATTEVTYEAPDRVASETVDEAGNRVAHQVVIGTDMWAIDDGAWVTGQADWRTVAPFTLLDALTGACTTEADGWIVAWDGGDGCDRPLGEAVDGTGVWAVKVDGDGRIAHVSTGELQPEPADSDVRRPGLHQLASLPVGVQLEIAFRYGGVPEVTVPEGATSAPEAPNETQTLAARAFAALGWTPQGIACCLQAPGSAGAQLGVLRGDQQVPIVGSPISDHTFDHEGSPAVFVRDNDYVIDAEPVDLAGTHGVAGDANGYPFAAFTCGGYLWTIGGLFGNAEPPVDPDLVISVATDFAGALACEPGDRPVAPGHGDPHG